MTDIINISEDKSENGRDNRNNNENKKGDQNEYEYVTLFKNIFEQKQFPIDFNVWTITKQYKWINENLAKFCPNVPDSLIDFIPAVFCEIDHDRCQTELPDWINMDKYRKGQKFVSENYAAVMITKILGVIYAYSFKDALKVIILGGRGHTPYLGFTRYLSTVKRIYSWYSGEPWIKGTKAYKNMQFTRRMHLIIRKKLFQLGHEKIDAVTKFADPWCPDREILMQDFAVSCPFEKPGQRPYVAIENSPYRPKGINNADLAIVQASFIGVILLRPQEIGLHNITDEDLDAFCHMWKCYGYFLGMKDEYNFCRGSLEEIMQRTRDLYQYWVKPNFKDISPEWEHMSKCVVEPMNYRRFMYMPYKAMLLFATNALDLSMPRLYTSLSYPEWIAYKSYKFFFEYVLKLSSIRITLNKFLRNGLEKMNITPKMHAELQEKSKKQLADFSIKF